MFSWSLLISEIWSRNKAIKTSLDCSSVKLESRLVRAAIFSSLRSGNFSSSSFSRCFTVWVRDCSISTEITFGRSLVSFPYSSRAIEAISSECEFNSSHCFSKSPPRSSRSVFFKRATSRSRCFLRRGWSSLRSLLVLSVNNSESNEFNDTPFSLSINWERNS